MLIFYSNNLKQILNGLIADENFETKSILKLVDEISQVSENCGPWIGITLQFFLELVN